MNTVVTYVMVVFFAAALIYAFHCAMAIRRIDPAYQFCCDKQKIVSDLAQADISAGREWEWRYVELDRQLWIGEIMEHWWRPLDSFITDDAFLRPAEIGQALIDSVNA